MYVLALLFTWSYFNFAWMGTLKPSKNPISVTFVLVYAVQKVKGSNLKDGVASFELQIQKGFSQAQRVSRLQSMYLVGKYHRNAIKVDQILEKNIKDCIIKVYCYLCYIYRHQWYTDHGITKFKVIEETFIWYIDWYIFIK